MGTQWITRHGGKRAGFTYENSKGRVVRDRKQLERIDAMKIPPAWRDVHIAASSRPRHPGVGFRREGAQAIPLSRARRRRARTAQVLSRTPARARPAAHSRVALRRDRQRNGAHARSRRGRRRAAHQQGVLSRGQRAIRARESHLRHLVAAQAPRAHRGERNRLRVQGEVEQAAAASSSSIARSRRSCARCSRSPGTKLFRYTDGTAWKNLSERDVNDYVRRVTSVRYTAKDFRTWGGTVRVATVLSDLGAPASDREAKKNVVLAIRLVSAELGNTPAICRASYVHPIVLARYLDHGETILPRAIGEDGGRTLSRGAGAHPLSRRALSRAPPARAGRGQGGGVAGPT